MSAENKSSKLYLTRIFDAPVQVVWDAWTDPEQAAQWWGPRGFTISTKSKDLRPGGSWVYTMYGPDGVEYKNISKYHEVETCAKLVYDHGAGEDSPPLFRVCVLFSEISGKTKMEMCMTLPSPEAAERTRGFIKKAGGDSTWDRLAEYLEKQSSGKEIFVINRSFEAAIEQTFEVWTNPDHLSKWLPPTGFQMQYLRSDIKVGASTFYLMNNNSGIKMYGKAEYLEIEKPRRLVYKQWFCDENEKTSRHPLAPTWPETMQTTVQFNEEGKNRTRVTITWECIGKVLSEELQTFINGRSGMTIGWTGSFDKLEEYLEQSLEKAVRT